MQGIKNWTDAEAAERVAHPFCYRLRQCPPRILSAQADQFGLRKGLFDDLRERFAIEQFATHQYLRALAGWFADPVAN
jgi:hypothetical protein